MKPFIPDSYRGMLAEAVPITREEEHRLGVIIQSSDNPNDVAEAKNKLVMANLRYLFIACAQEYYIKPPICFEDIISCGIDGYYEAASRFDPDRGTKFATYAKKWAQQRINKYIRTTSTCAYVPPGTLYQIDFVRQLSAELMQRTMEDVDYLGLAADLNLDMNRINSAVSCLQYEEYNDEVVSCQSGEDEIADGIMMDKIMAIVSDLPAREKDVFCRRHGLQCHRHTLREIGHVLNLSRERIRQILGKAESRVREGLAAQDPPQRRAYWDYELSESQKSSMSSASKPKSVSSSVGSIMMFSFCIRPKMILGPLYLYPIKEEIKERNEDVQKIPC